MKCKIICDLLPLYIDDVCSDETKELVEQHLNTCSGCRREYEKMKAEITMNKMEDMDEKTLMERGKETMTEHVKEKLYRRGIFGDTILNLLLAVCLFIYSVQGPWEEFNIFALMNIGSVFFGIFLGADIIYWGRYIMKRDDRTVIIDTICKMSIWMKVGFVIFAVAGAAVVGFYTLL